MHEDWRYAGAVKRRHSQRSPSRPRSQQGSQAAQIASVKEAERAANDNGRFERRGNEMAEERVFQHGEEQQDSPRKTPRLEQFSSASGARAAAGGQTSSDWPMKRPTSQISESEPTSASSSRIRMSQSHASSIDDDQGHRLPVRRTGPNGEGVIDQEEEANYTWRHRDRVMGRESTERGEAGGPSSPSTKHARLPPLVTGFRSNLAPSSAPASATQLEAEGRSSERSSSPPPRLPGFAALSPYQHHSTQRRTPPSSSQQHQQQPPSHQQHGHQRGGSFGMPSYANVTSPRVTGPSSMSANSPSLSQASHATPGQAFIHPSLAGLPGAGGGAGSKQQPSFVSKLYSMLEDDTIEDMIAWGPSGTTFSVANPAEFAKVVLPNWFKHSNWQSFVRQLNMYGFHKVNHTYQGTPEEEIQVWEFKHPSFRRGEVHLLSEIKRKSSRHKRQDSLSRSMTNAADYDIGGTPSPEMGMSHMHGHLGGPPPPPGFGGPQVRSHPGQSVHHSYSRSIGGPAGSVPGYREYHDPSPTTLPHSHHPGTSQSGMTHPEHVAGAPAVPREAILSTEGVTVRMDDLSDRIDAIIRHATYLEGQLRTVSDQLFHSQQNEASLRTHVHHLESQMRSLSDQLFQQRQNPALVASSALAPQRGPSPSQHGSTGIPPPPSPSSASLNRMRLQGGSPPPREATRFQPPPPPSSAQAYPSRSPVMAHPSYAARSAPGTTGSGRSTPASSADAYTKLGPPPPPGGVRTKDEML